MFTNIWLLSLIYMALKQIQLHCLHVIDRQDLKKEKVNLCSSAPMKIDI